MKETHRISVIGSGSWGTTLSDMFARNGIETTLYVRNKNLYESMVQTGENSVYLKSIKLDKRLCLTNSLSFALEKSDIIVTSIPVKYLRESLEALKKYVKNNHIFVSSSKGIENDTFFRPSEIIGDVLGINEDRIAVISGPNFAKEVARQLPSATVLASSNKDTARMLQQLFNNRYFRVYTSQDIAGVEICGALKNIIAIASGISDGLNLGHNAKASLITRGIAEMTKFGGNFSAKKETFMGLAGVGDLVLTCTGDLSRNRKVGLEIVKKRDINNVLDSMVMVAEGVNTVKSVFEWSLKNGVDMPISKGVYDILYNSKNPKDAVEELMRRPLKSEF